MIRTSVLTFQSVMVALTMLLLASSLTRADAQSASDRNAVLAANTEFHQAFRESDMDTTAAVWGETEPIAVEHPSSWHEEGREAVLGSWATILQSPLAIACHVEALTFDKGRATVLCHEDLNLGHARMISIFHREGGLWKMIYHGPAPETVTSWWYDHII